MQEKTIGEHPLKQIVRCLGKQGGCQQLTLLLHTTTEIECAAYYETLADKDTPSSICQ